MEATIAKLVDLLAADTDVPQGVFLLEQRGAVRVVWRVSDGGPADEAIEAAPEWWKLLPA